MRKWCLFRLGLRLISTKSSIRPQEIAVGVKEGDKLYGYTVENVADVPELELIAVNLTHDASGAKHLHLARDDSNNAFGVAFRTVPRDNTGVAHILEHTALCGSRKYPVRDPFFKMMNRSLATFMNAYTANDWTFFPFATQNQTDYYNLMSVYMDSVFRPLLRKQDFRQEGWRLEHADPKDPCSEIIFKGVVFNEMKGYFASPENVYMQMAQNLLYPSTTYSNVSGGTPLSILDLTWDQLKAFHALHYHPSNARFFTYGNLPLTGHIEQLNQDLKHYEKSSVCTEVPFESRWHKPREHFETGPLSSSAVGKCFVGVSFLLSPVADSYSSLLLSVMGQLLVSGPSSPFYQSLIEKNIGSEYTPNTGYDTTAKESSFSVGLQGVNNEDINSVKDIIWDTLTKVSRIGFEKDRVQSVLHQIELEQKNHHGNFGLSLMMMLISPWIHDGDPVEFLLIKKDIESLKKETTTFWADCVDRFLLKNNHCHTLVMDMDVSKDMDEQCRESMSAKEGTKIKQILTSFSDCDRRQIYTDGLELIQDQDSPSSHETCLPSLHIADISRLAQPVHLHHDCQGSVPLQYSEQPTNRVTYFQALSGLNLLPDDLKIFIPLFCAAITQFGTEKYDHRQFLQFCDRYTGGIAVDCYSSSHYKSLSAFDHGVVFSSYCLEDNVSIMLDLLEELFCRFLPIDEEKLRVIINMAANRARMGVNTAGHIYAMRSAASGLTPATSMSEIFSGLTQMRFLNILSETQNLSDATMKLNFLASHVLNSRSLRCLFNTTKSTLPLVRTAVDRFLLSLQDSSLRNMPFPEATSVGDPRTNTDEQFDFPVNYVALCFKAIPYIHEDSPRLQVLSEIMTMKYLHKEIREKGGAYGAGAITNDGIFSFFSFRDPNAESTLSTFYRCIRWCLDGNFSEDDVDEAKLLVIAKLDHPVSPGSRGSLMFLHHISPEMQQFYRQQIFGITKESLVLVTERYLFNNQHCGSAVIC